MASGPFPSPHGPHHTVGRTHHTTNPNYSEPVDAQGLTAAEREWDDFLCDELAADLERERVEGHWPAEVHRPVVRTSDDWLEEAA